MTVSAAQRFPDHERERAGTIISSTPPTSHLPSPATTDQGFGGLASRCGWTTIMTRLLPKRPLGRTGLNVSVLGMGGFHQVETDRETISVLLERYLAAGGNYVETAKYGNGASEQKLGEALEGRREQVVLVSKTGRRREEEAWREINESLDWLRTDHLDIHLFHSVGDSETLDEICAPRGALRAFQRARDEGLVRFFGLSSHWPLLYVDAADRLPLDMVLLWANYLDFCNYPEIPGVVLPALRERGLGITFMKPFADGYLYRSPRPALRYALAQEVDCIVAGFNSLTQLETDLAVCCDDTPVTDEEITAILRDAPELGAYVCRQCPDCPVGPEAATLKRVFELEGKYDRQMDDRRPPADAAQYALQERLKGWFGTRERAQELYAQLGEPAPALAGRLLAPCPFGLDLPRKLRIAHAKLSRTEREELL